MYDVKFYEDGREQETVRGLNYAQRTSLKRALDREDVEYTIKER